jgi:hypothetical protein
MYVCMLYGGLTKGLNTDSYYHVDVMMKRAGTLRELFLTQCMSELFSCSSTSPAAPLEDLLVDIMRGKEEEGEGEEEGEEGAARGLGTGAFPREVKTVVASNNKVGGNVNSFILELVILFLILFLLLLLLEFIGCIRFIHSK